MSTCDDTTELTEAEKLFDSTVAEQRRKGRSHYGRGLSWSDGDGPDAPYDWRHMALEEAVDLTQYLCAEILRLRYTITRMTRSMPPVRESGPYTFDHYQKEALVTCPADEPLVQAFAIRALGLAGEAGEVVEQVKKYLGHGHELDRDLLRKELGDVLWYVATLAHAADLSMGEVAEKNIEKLRQRYPQGFSHDASRNRTA